MKLTITKTQKSIFICLVENEILSNLNYLEAQSEERLYYLRQNRILKKMLKLLQGGKK